MILRFVYGSAKFLAILLALWAAFGAPPASAGPPFVTDDPEPTDYRHWEIYSGFQYENDIGGGASLSTPFVEFNYGAMPNVQVSFAAQTHQVEFGVKTRFVQETGGSPQIAFYPSVVVPSVAGERAVPLLPIWLQKSWGKWTAFAGGGVYLNSNVGMRDSTFVGAALERAISPGVTVGAELYHQSADAIGGSDTTAANIGMIAQVGQYHAILLSFGRALHGTITSSVYASYEFALGPER